MKTHALLLIAMLAPVVAHAESAFTVRATDLQAQAQSDAATLATLPENTKVDVLRRVGAWSEVKTAAGKSGWVRMLTLRFDAKAAPQGTGSANALSDLLSTGRTANTATVTTGVRGLTEEDLQKAQANPAELAKMQRYAADNNTARNFAQRSKLAAVSVDYLPAKAASSPKPDSVPMTSPELQN